MNLTKKQKTIEKNKKNQINKQKNKKHREKQKKVKKTISYKLFRH